jgi:hypothetical protein
LTQYISCLYTPVKREVFYNILIEFGICMKLVKLIKVCLNETYSEVCVGRHASDTFPVQSGLNQGDALLLLLVSFTLEYAIRKIKKMRWD